MSKNDLINIIDDIKDTWSLHAKVLRKWVVRRKTAPYAVWKIGMLLIDEELTRVEVSVTQRSILNRYVDEPKEGIVYNFKNFEVVENNDKYRVTSHPWCFDDSDTIIHDLGYRFIDISELRDGNIKGDDLTDVLGFLQSFGRLQDQRRENDIVKRLNFTISDHHENSINVSLWGSCAEETYNKKHENMEPPIIVLLRFGRVNRNIEFGHLSNAFTATYVTFNPDIPEVVVLKERLSQESQGSQLFSQITNIDFPTNSTESLLSFRTRITVADIIKMDHECDVVTKVTIQKVETLYGWFYDACPCDKKPEYQSNGSLRCTKCNKDVLMTVPKYKIHYKVFDLTGKCSIIFFDRHATELLGKSAAKVKEDMQMEGRRSTIPEELDQISGRVVIVKLRIKSYNIKHRTSSIAVTQLCSDNHLVQQFTYSNTEDPQHNMPEESSDSRQTMNTMSDATANDDQDPMEMQLITPPGASTKRKVITGVIPTDCDVVGLSELSTPSFSSTKLLKNIKKEK